jgi:hypothetical protein
MVCDVKCPIVWTAPNYDMNRDILSNGGLSQAFSGRRRVWGSLLSFMVQHPRAIVTIANSANSLYGFISRPIYLDYYT